MATFLTLTNELLREMNEVALTSATFGSAIGIQQHAKDLINRSYLDIVTEETKWPFLATAESGAVDPTTLLSSSSAGSLYSYRT